MKLKNKRILVTGHDGFIGNYLLPELEVDNEIVTLAEDGGFIDIRDWNKIQEIDDVDVIYHLAAVTFVPYSFDHPRETYEVNVCGTLNMLELARLRDVEKVVVMSSYVYGRPEYLPIDENHPLKPNNPYTHSKLVMEKLCQGYSSDFSLNCVILRPFNIYGPGQGDNFLVPSIVKQLPLGRIQLQDPEPKRDFVYVEDVIRAMIKAGAYKTRDNIDIFNVGYGKSFKVKEIASKIVELYGKEVQVAYTGQSRKNEVMDTVADITHIQDKMGWKPLTSLDDGLSMMLRQPY
ncbi:MAG: GDP-mannose 4,6-dehydratase [Methanobacteriaceae archaeon]|nr:GDP-mannose 4,6-dehydratase [Methanobacteriaceae archaeon]